MKSINSTSRFEDALRHRLYGENCVYCGEIPNSREHFPPATYSRTGIIFPACKECNGFAGTAFCCEFSDRVTHVKTKIRQKYRREVDMPDWSEEEIEEVSYNIKTGVQACMKIKKIARERLVWNAEQYLRFIDDGQHFAEAAVEMHTIIENEKQNWRATENGATNTTLSPRPVSRYNIRHHNMWAEEARECQECGSPFYPKVANQKFCSPGCNSKWYKEVSDMLSSRPARFNQCPECLSLFQPKNMKHRFCSAGCGVEWNQAVEKMLT